MRSDKQINAGKLIDYLLEQDSEHAIILLDLEGLIIDWRGASGTIFGYSAEEVIGHPVSILFTPEDIVKGVPLGECDIARQGAPAEDDRWMLRKDGIRFWATGVLQSLRDADGNIVGFVKTLRNRTDLKGYLEGLDSRIQSLEALNERKNRFISTLAHELRNPLASISNATVILAPLVEGTEDGAFVVALLQRQLDSIRRMVDDLLDITRITSGKLKLTLRQESLEDIVKAAVETCRPLLDNRTDDFHLILGSSPINVQADAPRLQQVFVNLIENAAKYTEYGGKILIKIMVEGREALIKFEDEGIGISPEVLPRIFEMFTQSEFVGNNAKGLGIGLSVVKDLVQLHGGSVQVRSDGIGKGSEFVVRLPLAGADQFRPDSPLA